MAMDLYINSYGAYIHKVGELFELEAEVEGEKIKQKISPKKIRSIIISTHARITTDVINLAVTNNIDIVLLDDFGNPYGRFWHSRFGSTAFIRRKQIEKFESLEGLEFVKSWIGLKIENNIAHLKELEYKRHNKFKEIEKEIEEMKKYLQKIYEIDINVNESRNIIMAYEGNSSKHYYSTLAYLIPQEFKFEGRSRRPAKDEFNAMLNYAFGVLYGKVEKALIVAGLDPYIGILHTDNYNKKSLVFDIIEKYRFIATKTVFSLFSTKKVNKNYFDKITKGLKLNKDGKQVLLKNLTEKFEKRKRYNGRMLTNLQIIQHEAHELANRLIEGEK
jgi:CRISPR-associated protein Cas1